MTMHQPLQVPATGPLAEHEHTIDDKAATARARVVLRFATLDEHGPSKQETKAFLTRNAAWQFADSQLQLNQGLQALWLDDGANRYPAA